LLTADHRFVFTLIQKFVTKGGATYSKLSDRAEPALRRAPWWERLLFRHRFPPPTPAS
jgi:hypothetical protein